MVMLTLAHTGDRVSEVLAFRTLEVDLGAVKARIQTLRRCIGHWRGISRWCAGSARCRSGV